MAVGDISWTLTACIALSLPPVLLILLVKRSKRSDKARSSAPNVSCCRRTTANVTSHNCSNSSSSSRSSFRYGRHRAYPQVCATMRFSCGRRCYWGASAPCTRGTATLLCVLVHALTSCTAGVWAFGTGSLMTVRRPVATQQVDSKYQHQRRTPSSYLAGKVVWVTGASSGLGEQFAISAAAGGAEGVILSGRREDALERVRLACEETRPAGAEAGRVRILAFDIGDLEYAEKTAATEAMGEFGRVDTLVLNAGISTRGSVEDTPLEVEKRVMAVNYFGAVGLTKGLLETRPLMTPAAGSRTSKKVGAAGTGGSTGKAPAVHFVVINSVQGKFGLAFRSSYAASKHALVGFFDCLRAEQAHRGVRVLSVFPGYVRTSLSMNALTANGRPHAQMDATTAAGRNPRDVADEVWAAAAEGKDELIVADLKVKVAVLLRAVAPRMMFRVMAKRALKEGAH